MAAIMFRTEEFINRVNEKFAAQAESETTEYYKPKYVLTGEAGRKYDKVIINDNRVFLFMDRETGDIYKPASWKAPQTNHIRYAGHQLDFAIEKADDEGRFLRNLR